LPPFGAQFSYVLSGELTHKDSLGNVEVLKRGEVQFTSAGSGIRHSEYNDHPSEAVHFLQYVLFCAELWNQV
jgi:redox-sensitive bicupin YhaK (pirin superfamily)